MLEAASWILATLSTGAGVYCLLVWVAAWRYLAVDFHPFRYPDPVSVLKPLAGLDEGLEDNLRSFFVQDHPSFEILLAVRTPDDPAVAVVQRLQREYPKVPSRLLLVGEPPYANAKVWSLERMTQEARYDLLVMSDSDIRVKRRFLRTVATEFDDSRVGVTTCPYRAVPGRTFASITEAIGMNTEFIGGVLVARMLEGMKFALGPTLSARKAAIQDAGGWPYLAEFLAEDFVLGRNAAEKGWKVLLSSYVVEHRIGSQSLLANARHRIRWNRSTRRSRPAGYVGQVFTNPLPFALPLLLLKPEWFGFVAIILSFRLMAGVATAGLVLKDPLTTRLWLLVPLQDFLSFGFWVAGFFGNTIQWRGRTYYLLPDGRFRLLQDVTTASAAQP